MHIRYRADIDGLRAISVISVVLFHVGLTSTFRGGFVGVDVFFVISGYLIATQIYARLADDPRGAWSFLGWFYERRLRRILPAFLFVSALTGIAAYAFYLPDRFQSFAESLLASLAFSANIYFWLTAGYFDAEAHTKPLLHYWSLGVEEHFYLFFPVAMFILWRFGMRMIGGVLAALFAASLIASAVALDSMSDAVFYLIQFRAWELLAGSILALPGVPPPKNSRWALLALTAGLVILIYAIGFTDPTRFPGLAAVPPVAGAVLIIWGGVRPNLLSRLLGNPPMRYVGLISYSLYLAHWPVIVFAHHLFPHLQGPAFVVGTVMASVALAMFSYHFIEKPTRSRSGIWTAARIVSLTLGLASVSAVLALAVVLTGGFAGRMPGNVQELLAYRFDHRSGYREGICFLSPEMAFRDLDKEVCLPKGPRVALLWGDSFAAHYVPGLKPRLERAGYTFAQANASLCAPILNRVHPSRPHCKEFNDAVLGWVKQHRPALVILSATWPADRESLNKFDATLAALGRIPGVSVAVVGQAPLYREKVSTLLAERRMHSDMSDYSRPGDLLPMSFGSDRVIVPVVKKHSEARFVSVIETACPNRTCRMAEDNRPFHIDRGHMSDVGSDYYSEMLFPLLLQEGEQKAP